MLACVDIKDLRSLVREDLAIPDFDQGTHFYLDIDYCTHKERYRQREEKETQVTPDVFQKRRERYQELCALEYLICIDATKDKETIAKQIQEILH